MGKDKKRKLSETSSSIGDLQREGNFKIDPEEIPKALDDSSWPYVFKSQPFKDFFCSRLNIKKTHTIMFQQQTSTQELHQVKFENKSLHAHSVRTQSVEETSRRLREVRML